MNYKIVGKYIKKINFEIPNPKIFFLLSKNISNYKINIDIKSNQIKEKIIEVQTTLSLEPKTNDFEKINTKLTYSTIIELLNETKDKNEIEKIVLIKIPTEIYPNIFDTFVYLFAQAGIKNLSIDKKVDFQKLYNERNKS